MEFQLIFSCKTYFPTVNSTEIQSEQKPGLAEFRNLRAFEFVQLLTKLVGAPITSNINKKRTFKLPLIIF